MKCRRWGCPSCVYLILIELKLTHTHIHIAHVQHHACARATPRLRTCNTTPTCSPPCHPPHVDEEPFTNFELDSHIQYTYNPTLPDTTHTHEHAVQPGRHDKGRRRNDVLLLGMHGRRQFHRRVRARCVHECVWCIYESCCKFPTICPRKICRPGRICALNPLPTGWRGVRELLGTQSRPIRHRLTSRLQRLQPSCVCKRSGRDHVLSGCI